VIDAASSNQRLKMVAKTPEIFHRFHENFIRFQVGENYKYLQVNDLQKLS
jgi:hypothetical protein